MRLKHASCRVKSYDPRALWVFVARVTSVATVTPEAKLHVSFFAPFATKVVAVVMADEDGKDFGGGLYCAEQTGVGYGRCYAVVVIPKTSLGGILDSVLELEEGDMDEDERGNRGAIKRCSSP